MLLIIKILRIAKNSGLYYYEEKRLIKITRTAKPLNTL